MDEIEGVKSTATILKDLMPTKRKIKCDRAKSGPGRIHINESMHINPRQTTITGANKKMYRGLGRCATGNSNQAHIGQSID